MNFRKTQMLTVAFLDLCINILGNKILHKLCLLRVKGALFLLAAFRHIFPQFE